MARTAKPDSELHLRTKWYVWIRWFIVLAIVLPSFASLYLGSGLTHERHASLIESLVLIVASGVFYAASRKPRGNLYDRILASAILVFDVLFISYFIYSKGGIESRSQLLYAMPILISAALFGRLGLYMVASGAALSYDFVIIANYFGWLHSPDAVTHEAANGTYVLNTIIFFTAVIMLVGLLADFLTRLLIRKEHEASQTAAALKRAQQIARLGSWEWDVASNEVSWSDELYDIMRVARGTPMTFESFLEYVHPEDRSEAAATITSALKSHQPFHLANRIITHDGQTVYLSGEGKVLADRRGRAVHMFGVVQDVTAERELEAAKGDFVALASHQLRTPASGVRMLLAMLHDGYQGELTGSQLETVTEAYEANERLLRIADDLLNVAKLESGRLLLNKQRIELAAWLKATTHAHQLLAKQQRQKLRVELPPKTVTIQADPARLGMVVDNLLSNACKYTPARGTIRIHVVVGKRIVKLIVADSGAGMSKAETAHLFGKFTRLDNPASKGAEGTGLGLYLAKSIVDLHRGSIKVASKPGVGSTFTVTLPKS